MNQPNNIHVYPGADELTAAAADFIADLATKAVEQHGRFTMSLSGGHTPERLYNLLATPPYSNSIPWKHTYIFWGDERCVSIDDKDNNAHMAMSALLDKIAIPAGNIYRIPVNLTPADAALAYEQTLKKFFNNAQPVFDLILLGLGENGHTASLFPGTDVLEEQQHWIKEVYVTEQKMFRITMTFPLINMAGNIIFLVEGDSKAAVLNKVLTGTQTDRYPAQLICPLNGQLYWFLDKKSAALLPE